MILAHRNVISYPLTVIRRVIDNDGIFGYMQSLEVF
jgi:hypothetical protein